MSISDEDKRAIDSAVKELHFVEKDSSGYKFIKIDANYRDTNEGLLQDAYDKRREGFESKDNPENALRDALVEEIDGWYSDTKWDMEDEVIRRAGFDPSDDMAEEQLEYLRDTFPFVPDYDHFLDQDMKVNIMLGTEYESNRDFVGIYEQYCAIVSEDISPKELKAELANETGLSWLVKQQGHTMDELKKTMDEYTAFFESKEANALKDYSAKYEAFCSTHNRFLASVCQELIDMPNSMNTMTVLTNMSMNNFADFMQPGKEIVLPKESMIGIFNPWNGGGSCLDIELEKDLVIPSELLYDVQIEGAKLNYQYSVGNVYGLIGSAWKNHKGVRDAQPERATESRSLADKIASASSRASAAQSAALHHDISRGSTQERG